MANQRGQVIGPHVTAGSERRDWRQSPFASVPTAAADDLAALHGVAHGRNVVIVGLESTAAQYLPLCGGGDDIAPTLTALSRDGVVFEHAYAAYPREHQGIVVDPVFDVPRLRRQPAGLEQDTM